MPRTQDPVNAQYIFNSAESFLKLTKAGIKTKEDNAFTMSYNEAIIATHAFACELYMKCIYAIQTGLTNHGHSLKEIFEGLTPDTRKQIEDLYNELRPKNPTDFDVFFGQDENFEDAIINPHNAYELFRYAYESSEKRPKTIVYKLQNVLLTLRKYIIQKQPDWPVLNGPA